MSSLASLTSASMLGLPTALPPLPRAALPEDDPAAALLIAAAVIGIGELGGCLPAQVENERNLCAAEGQSYLSKQAASLLKRILASEFPAVLPEFLQLTAQQRLLVPPEMLPALLGLEKSDLRRPVLPVIGARGRWLAAQNPAWSYARQREAQDAWEHGRRAERLAALESLRGRDPSQARQWIQAAWEQESPEERAALIATLSTGLSLEDEPLLEACLDDKRKEVRQAGRGLLLRLEGSRLVQRMWERARPLLKIKSKFLGRETLEVSLPEGWDAAAKRDGLGGAQLRKKMGEKANLLAQLLASVPPALWSRELGRPPEKLIAAALGSEWKEALLLGWQLATLAVEDVAWAEALVPLWAAPEGRELLAAEEAGALIRLARPEKIEALVREAVKPVLAELDDQSLLISLLEQYQRPWSVRLARLVVQSAQRQSGALRHSLPLALPAFAHWIPPELAAEFAHGWSAEAKGFWPTRINEFLALLNFRSQVLAALHAAP